MKRGKLIAPKLEKGNSILNMQLFVCFDLLLNVCLPVLVGGLLYNTKTAGVLPAFMAYHVHDGLWAYGFASAILIIWKRKVHLVWLCVAFLTSVSFELLQHLHQIAGTGDPEDVIAYFIFFLFALPFNNFFKHLLQPKPQQNAKN